MYTYTTSKLEDIISGVHGVTYQLVFVTSDIGNIHIMRGWTQFFEFFSSKDVDSNKMDFCMTMLAGLGGAHFNNFTGPTLDYNMTVSGLA